MNNGRPVRATVCCHRVTEIAVASAANQAARSSNSLAASRQTSATATQNKIKLTSSTL